MLRAAQMLVAAALKRHLLGRSWKPGAVASNRQAVAYRAVLRAVADEPGERCAFSVHNLVAVGPPHLLLWQQSGTHANARGFRQAPAAPPLFFFLHTHRHRPDAVPAAGFGASTAARQVGMATQDKLPGEWFGPGAAAHALRALAELQRGLWAAGGGAATGGAAAVEGEPPAAAPGVRLAVVVSPGDAIYVDQVLAAAAPTTPTTATATPEGGSGGGGGGGMKLGGSGGGGSDGGGEADAVETATPKASLGPSGWEAGLGLVVLVPVRLGLNALQVTPHMKEPGMELCAVLPVVATRWARGSMAG